MLGRGAARSECGRGCLPQAVQTPGAAAVWSGLPAVREEAQSKGRRGRGVRVVQGVAGD